MLEFDSIEGTQSTATLTISGQNHIPLVAEITVVGNCEAIPIPAFTCNQSSVCVNSPVNIIDMSLNFPKNWQWNISPNTVSFINQTSDSSQFPIVVFHTSGEYSVSLSVSNAYGTADTTINALVNVFDNIPNFVASKYNVDKMCEVTFYDTTQCDSTINSYYWEFGEGANPPSATSKGPHSVKYETAGAKSVTLIVNERDTITKIQVI